MRAYIHTLGSGKDSICRVSLKTRPDPFISPTTLAESACAGRGAAAADPNNTSPNPAVAIQDPSGLGCCPECANDEVLEPDVFDIKGLGENASTEAVKAIRVATETFMVADSRFCDV